MKEPLNSGLQISDDAYRKLKISKERIEPWEDGMRTDGSKGTYEWWYFDSHLNDGAKLVIIFYTKHIIDVNKSLSPMITVQYDAPGGAHCNDVVSVPAAQFSSSRDGCDVRIGDSSFVGDLNNYSIRFAGKTVQAEVTLAGRVRPWRPGTGHIAFGNSDEHFFAWLPSVPEGKVEAKVTVGGQARHLTGTGYHDHNWGNIAMPKLMNHWYWGRAKIGGYTVISSYITGEKKYGHKTYPIFMLAKGREVIADDALKFLKFAACDERVDDLTKKPYHKLLIYDYDDGRQHYKITYSREEDIARARFADTLPPLKGRLATLLGFDGAYLRFAGTAKLEKFENGEIVESVSEPAIWELMYLGRAQN
jgi:hypothetical protein